jgi:hypothetical protein
MVWFPSTCRVRFFLSWGGRDVWNKYKNVPTECEQKYVGRSFIFQPQRAALYFTDPLVTHTTSAIWTDVLATPEPFAYTSKYIHSSHASNSSSLRHLKWFRRNTCLKEDRSKPVKRPCRSSGGYSPASHRGGPCSSPGQVIWDLWRTKWHWGRYSPSTSVSPANSHSTECSTIIIIIYHVVLVQ